MVLEFVGAVAQRARTSSGVCLCDTLIIAHGYQNGIKAVSKPYKYKKEAHVGFQVKGKALQRIKKKNGKRQPDIGAHTNFQHAKRHCAAET
jgi:hypothetical protein